jgi:hypothetical protein
MFGRRYHVGGWLKGWWGVVGWAAPLGGYFQCVEREEFHSRYGHLPQSAPMTRLIPKLT